MAAIARETAAGAWVAPTLNGEPFLEQPPLYYWCAAIAYRLGADAMLPALRLVSLAFSLGAVLLTGLCAARLRGGPHAATFGTLAALSLALSGEFYYLAHRVVVDPALVFFTTAAAYGLVRASDCAERAPRAGWSALAAIAAALAFLSKGVIGLAAPALFLLALAWARRDARLLGGDILWIAPLALAVVAGPWLALVHEELGAESFRVLFVDNTLGRVLPGFEVGGSEDGGGGGDGDSDGERGHVRPFYYYAATPVHLLPALIAGIGGVLLRLRRRGALLDERARVACDTGVVWFLGGLLLLSLAGTKRQVYAVPFYPGFALVAALWLEAFLAGRAGGRYERFACYAPGSVLIVAAAALAGAPLALAGVRLAASVPAAALAVLAGGVAIVAAHRDDRRRALTTAGAGLLALGAGVSLGVFPPLDQVKRLDDVAAEIDRLVPAGARLHAFDPDETTEGMIPLYTGRALAAVRTEGELAALVETGDILWVLAVDKSYRRRQRRFEELAQYPHEVVLEDVRPRSRAFRLVRIDGGKAARE